MVQDIIQIGHPKLRLPAKTLSRDEILDSETQTLITAMIETMRAAPGVGLAATQIGIPMQIVVIEDRPEYTKSASKEQLELKERKPFPLQILINPKIISQESKTAKFFEGCLSIEGLIGVVPRWLSIQVEAFNEKAEPITINATGWQARILQHEIDHLDGILCTDRMKISTLMTIDNYVQYWLDKPISDLCDHLN